MEESAANGTRYPLMSNPKKKLTSPSPVGQPTSPNGVVPPMERPSHQESYQARALVTTLSFFVAHYIPPLNTSGVVPQNLIVSETSDVHQHLLHRLLPIIDGPHRRHPRIRHPGAYRQVNRT